MWKSLRPWALVLAVVVVAATGGCEKEAGECRKSADCPLLGRCVEDGSRCVAGSKADCVAAERACKRDGLCSLSRDANGRGRCAALTDSDCANAEVCKSSARCTAKEEKCVVGSDRDCRKLPRCSTHAECTYYSSGEKCIVGSDDDCLASDLCKNDDKCKWRPGATGREAGCFTLEEVEAAQREVAARQAASARPEVVDLDRPEKRRFVKLSSEKLAEKLLLKNDPDELWETRYQRKYVRWRGKWERKGVTVEFVASGGDLSSFSCKEFGPDHDASKFVAVGRWDKIRVEGWLEAYGRQLGKHKVEFRLRECVAKTR